MTCISSLVRLLSTGSTPVNNKAPIWIEACTKYVTLLQRLMDLDLFARLVFSMAHCMAPGSYRKQRSDPSPDAGPAAATFLGSICSVVRA